MLLPGHVALPKLPRRYDVFLLLFVLSGLQYIDLCSAFSMGGVGAVGGPISNTKMFKARYPLEGGPPQVKLHVAIIVEDINRGGGGNGATPVDDEKGGHGRRLVLFDFLPEEPTALSTTLRLLTGQDVRGKLRERDLRFLPPGTVCVGQSGATLDEMREFVATYPNRLSLISNNCYSFADAFVERHRLEGGQGEDVNEGR